MKGLLKFSSVNSIISLAVRAQCFSLGFGISSRSSHFDDTALMPGRDLGDLWRAYGGAALWDGRRSAIENRKYFVAVENRSSYNDCASPSPFSPNELVNKTVVCLPTTLLPRNFSSTCAQGILTITEVTFSL